MMIKMMTMMMMIKVLNIMDNLIEILEEEELLWNFSNRIVSRPLVNKDKISLGHTLQVIVEILKDNLFQDTLSWMKNLIK